MNSAPPKPIWQKVYSRIEGDRLRANQVDPLLGGLPDVINGFVTLARDAIQAQGAAALYNALRLDYPGSHFRLDEPVYAVRFTFSEVASIHVPDKPLARSVGKEGGVDLGYGPPVTGTGFSGSSEFTLPEYWVVDGIIDAGAELWFVPVEGPEQLAAVLVDSKEWVGVKGFGDQTS